QWWYELQTVYGSVLREQQLTGDDLNRIFRQMIESLLENYRQQSGKERLAEKSPNNVFVFEPLHLICPDSPLIHVIRDGRDVICSLLTMNWTDPHTGQPLDYTRDLRRAAEYWVAAVTAGRNAGQKPSSGRRYFELRYEDIVNQPVPTLQQQSPFIEEPWDSAVLKYYEQQRNLAGESSAQQVSQPLYTRAVSRWKHDLEPADKQTVKEVAGDLLIELGYATDRDW